MLAAGGMNATGTKFQKEAGVADDSVDLMIKDTMKGGGEINDPELVKILAANSAGSVDWLTSLGADMSEVGMMAGASAKRRHGPKGGKAVGAHLIDTLRKGAAERKIDVRVNSKVVKILQDAQGRVTGVEVEGKHRGTYTINAKVVVLTSGGFSANAERVASYRPEFKGMTSSNQPGATGDGLDLGAAAGGELKDMKEIQIHPTVAAGSRILITEAVRGNGAIAVNQEGKRFMNEMTTRDKASAAILAQTGKMAYLVFDEGVRKSLKQIEGYFHLELVKEGETPEALAKQIGAPPAALAATIAAYNKAVEAKNDAEFQRKDLPRALATPKYYAIGDPARRALHDGRPEGQRRDRGADQGRQARGRPLRRRRGDGRGPRHEPPRRQLDLGDDHLRQDRGRERREAGEGGSEVALPVRGGRRWRRSPRPLSPPASSGTPASAAGRRCRAGP